MVKSVLIVEDHALTRQAVCSLFASQEDSEICGDAENGQEAVEIAQVLRPDMRLLKGCPSCSNVVQVTVGTASTTSHKADFALSVQTGGF